MSVDLNKPETDRFERPEQSKIDKLPTWAKEYLKVLERERATAIRVMKEHIDNEKESEFSIESFSSVKERLQAIMQNIIDNDDSFECLGEERGPSMRQRYIQHHGSININAFDISMRIYLNEQRKSIEIQYEDATRACKEVAMVPSSYQQVHIINVKNLKECS